MEDIWGLPLGYVEVLWGGCCRVDGGFLGHFNIYKFDYACISDICIYIYIYIHMHTQNTCILCLKVVGPNDMKTTLDICSTLVYELVLVLFSVFIGVPLSLSLSCVYMYTCFVGSTQL